MPQINGNEEEEESRSAPQVRILPEIISNRIAAGEVVERPASVVKELIENSLDARAKRITVEIEKGGSDLIRVSDDGHGMSRENALLSIQRYATSKIVNDDDLFAIKTFGFRGEAIPSMASVSNFTMITREKGGGSGTRVDISGGKVISLSETGAPSGTMIEVKNLYFNTPARRKFLKTTNTEMGHIAASVAAFALAAPDVQFRLIHNGRTVKHYFESDDLLSRAGMVLGTESLSDLYAITLPERSSSEESRLYITGYITKPSVSRNSSGNILLFVNKRSVSDRALLSAILKGYRGRMMKGQFPMAALFITIPSDELDVNVHPAKLQVRFANPGLVFGSVFNAVHNALYQGERKQDSVVQSNSNSDNQTSLTSFPQSPEPEPFQPEKEGGFQHEISESSESYNFHTICQTERETDPQATPMLAENSPSTIFELNRAFSGSPLPDSSDQWWGGSHSEQPQPEQHQHSEQPQALLQYSEKPVNPGKIGGLSVIGQFVNTYIIAQSRRDEMVLIDQHAAHERVLYERLKRRSEGFRPPSQDMIVAEIVELNHKEAALLERMIPQLLSMGFEIEPFGGTSFVVKSVPAIADERPVRPMLLDMVGMAEEKMSEDETDRWLEEILTVAACHSAVRANHPLNKREMEQLLADLEKCDNPYHCPHGRPTVIFFSEKELEKRFKRVL